MGRGGEDGGVNSSRELTVRIFRFSHFFRFSGCTFFGPSDFKCGCLTARITGLESVLL